MIEIKTLMRFTIVALLACLFTVAAHTPALAAGLLDVPGFDFVIDRIKDHGYVGKAWDIKARPYTIYTLAMNDNGPLYFTIGAVKYSSASNDKWKPNGGARYNFLDLWDKARTWKYIDKMKLVKFPKDWKVLGGADANIFDSLPQDLRIDRALLFSINIHIPLGRSAADD